MTKVYRCRLAYIGIQFAGYASVDDDGKTRISICLFIVEPSTERGGYDGECLLWRETQLRNLTPENIVQVIRRDAARLCGCRLGDIVIVQELQELPPS